MWKNRGAGSQGTCIKFESKVPGPTGWSLGSGDSQVRVGGPSTGHWGRLWGWCEVPWGATGGWVLEEGCGAAIHQQAISPSYAVSCQHARARCSQLARMASVCRRGGGWCWGGCWGVSSQRDGWQLPRSPELTAVAESTSSTCQGSVRRSEKGSSEKGSAGETYQVSFSTLLALRLISGHQGPFLASDLPEPHPPVPIAHF